VDRDELNLFVAAELARLQRNFDSNVRNKLSGKRRRRRLLKALGGCCKMCGSTRDLTVDHINGRNYCVRKLSSHMRVTRYLREYEAGVPLQALCRSCHGKLEQARRRNARQTVPF